MTLTITLRPETEKRLRQQAAAAGRELSAFVLDALEKLTPASTDAGMSAEQWSASWHAWASDHPKLDHIADDSRESIYAGRGE